MHLNHLEGLLGADLWALLQKFWVSWFGVHSQCALMHPEMLTAAGLGSTPGGIRLKRPLKPPNSDLDFLNDFIFLQISELVIPFDQEVHTLNVNHLVVMVTVGLARNDIISTF